MLVPRQAPAVMPVASASSARLARGSLFSSHEPGLLGDADQRADGVEEAHEQEDDDERQQRWIERAADVQAEGGAPVHLGQADQPRVVDLPERERQRRRGQDAPEQRASHSARQQRAGADQAEAEHRDVRRAQRFDRPTSVPGPADDEAGVLEADRRDEQPDARPRCRCACSG